MKWFVAEDDFYYSTPIEKWHSHIESKFKEIPQEFESVVRLSKSFSGTKNIVLVPKEEDIEKVIREGKAGNAVFIAPYFPPEKIKSLFFIEQLPNLYGAFTTQEWEYITSFPEKERWKAEREILAEKLGLNIYKPKINTNSLVGMRGVKKYMLSIKNVKAKMLRAKGIFLVGLPGTGKSFSAKVAAATLDWYLVEMNLSKIMESTNPVFALHLSFKHLENLTKRFKQQAIAEGKREYPGFIIWIDEIEKMFTFQGNSDVEKRLFGQLLTILNDMNSDTGYHINGVFWVTANNITQIAENNPEFLRKGRFDELFFVDTPVNKDAEEIFNLYKGVYKFLFYGELFDDRTRLRENLRKARLGRFNPAEKKYMEVKNDPKYTFGTDVVHMIREVFYSEATDTTTSSEAIRFIYTPSEIAQVCKELAIRQKQKITMLSLKRKVD
uniref:AAA family ATPase n=1 Tax=Desulfurobacterium sp. TaxID=2004706 RepID=UPI00262A6646